MAEHQTPPGQTAGFAADFVECWNQLPNKAFFLSLLAAWVLLFQFLGTAVFAYADTPSLFSWLWNNWKDDANGDGDGHGKLIPFVVLALFYWKRRELLGVSKRAWWPGLVLLAVSLLLHVIAYIIQQPRLSAVAFFCGIYALMGIAWGPGWLRAGFFPFFLFAFCVPITTAGGPVASFTFHLRLLVSQLVTLFCNTILAIDVHREGTGLYNAANHYSYEVAAACSGLRSLIAIFALCTIYGFTTFQKNWKRILMMAAAVPLAVLGNMLRMLSIIIAAEMNGQPGGDHVHSSTIFGLLPYVPAILGILVLGRWLRENTREAALPLNPKPV